MPTYDYRCEQCDELFEIQKSMTSPHPTACPNCGEDGLRRVFGPLSIQVRGEHLRVERLATKVPPIEGAEIQPRSS